MKLFIATLSTETNTFCTMPTAMSGFQEYFLRHGTATQEPPNLMTEALHVWREKAEALDWQVVESLTAIAEPAGPTTRACYDALSGEILSDLADCGGADIILLQLHGAMVSEHIEDCEGDILARVRAQCPDATVGVSLDLHSHLTDKMLEASDLIVHFREYPHDDASACATELFDLAQRTYAGEITPRMAFFDTRMVNLYLTKAGAMKEFVAEMAATQTNPGVLSVSLSHGFPWADVKDVGARMLVITDDHPDMAALLAEWLGRRFFDLREDVTTDYLPIRDALNKVGTRPGLCVLADMGDNSGGGAPGDATHVLEAMLARGLTNFASGLFWDPGVVRICQDAGVGSRLTVRLGGKTGVVSGNPIDLNVTVMGIETGLGQHLGTGLEPMGTVVWLRLKGEIDLLVNDLRVQVYHPEAFEQVGIRLAEKSVVVVKSLFHFYGPFSQISDHIFQVASPGGTQPAFQNIALTKRKLPYWPAVAQPFADPARDLDAPKSSRSTANSVQ
ncbi:M81 family metallopeptidase [Ruegeria sp. Ofav3-42]|uniref:M81 family metallopeptidase n=1 Tax=Ruegeria sp. Ofav3-42 TaxID=2917759 RepID=UPI001EF6BC70|nr:M81 family metallopeptidase [Ruegeria sp. Ofav3-42]MCG7522054.1 M81 family metallopeptidase [Ruegeria sp. Ofav3-42]